MSEYLDITADPSPSEHRKMVSEDVTVAVLPVDDGFRGVVIPQQKIGTKEENVIAILCNHRHEDLTSALTCANEIANLLP
jgi:hypothetical protein